MCVVCPEIISFYSIFAPVSSSVFRAGFYFWACAEFVSPFIASVCGSHSEKKNVARANVIKFFYSRVSSPVCVAFYDN